MINSGKYILSKLFGSVSRVKILKFFLSHADGRYYIRQIARDLDLQLNSVRRELENLEQFGLLVSTGIPKKDEKILTETEPDPESPGESEELVEETTEEKPALVKEASNKTDKKYYSVNKDFILFEEIKALFVKAQVLYEKDFSERILEVGQPKLFILSGFFVNADDSPTDILLVGRLSREKVSDVISEFERELDRELRYTIMDMDEFAYRRDITDVFLYEILGSKKIVVIDELDMS